MKRVLIFGYYNRQNWGDDVFEYVFRHHIFKDSSKYELIFKNLDNLNKDTDVYQTVDKVVIGGGDLINNYFFDDSKIVLFRQFFVNKPIYFVGIGLTYPNLISVMDIGDFFFMRNKTDGSLVKNRYTDAYGKSIPDIAFNLLDESSLINFNKPYRAKKDINKIGIALPAPWLDNKGKRGERFVDRICELALDLSRNHEVHFIPFDTSIGTSNSDIQMIMDIQEELNGKSDNIFYLIPNQQDDGKYNPISTNEMIEYFKALDLVVCGRFHATILSIITHTPFVCIHASTKLKNLRKDMKDIHGYFIELETDEKNKPIKFPKKQVMDTIRDVKNNYIPTLNKLKNYASQMKEDTDKFNSELLNLIDNNDSLVTFRQSPPQYITSEQKKVLLKTTISNVLQKVSNKISIHDIDAVLNGRTLLSVLPKSRFRNLESFKKMLTEEILWSLTGDPYAPYYYGLYENVLNSNFATQIRWIIDDYYENYAYKQPHKNNITIVNKNFQRLHRSGWQFIVNNIVMQLNNNDNINEPLIVDTYIDKTFHWNREFYMSKGVIPYNRKWIGFIHHTYSNYNNNYNCLELFKNDTFIQSLMSCKALIVMTQYLSDQVSSNLRKLGFTDVKVHTILHPTEATEIKFTWDNFMNNENKQLVQVGNWLRDVFGIYRVTVPDGSIINQKSILKNKNSENYFPPNNFLDDLYCELNDENNKNDENNVVDICRNDFKNMHIKGLYHYIVEMEESVKVIEFLDNSEYDDLLSKNIVFLKLMDASACNTLIECVVRNTPIIINPIPPVVEILGEDYPLYYNNYYDVSKILDNPSLIKQGYDYLVNMPKDQLDISNFIKELTDIVTQYTN